MNDAIDRWSKAQSLLNILETTDDKGRDISTALEFERARAERNTRGQITRELREAADRMRAQAQELEERAASFDDVACALSDGEVQ